MQTNNDPNKGILTAKALGLLDPVENNDPLSSIGSESSVFEGGFDSELDSGILPNINVNEQRAALQSGWDHLGAGMGRAVGRFASEVAKMPGTVGGLLKYGYAEGKNAMFGEGFGQENFGEYINNAWVKTLEGISETVNEELPVYTADAVKNGNLWDNITSSSFWANEGADGLGFLASFFVPGAFMKGFGLVGKGSNNLGRIGDLARKTGLGILVSKNLEIGSIAAMNAVFESGAEAANGYDTIYEELRHKEQERQRNWDPSNGEFVAKTDEELKSLAGEAAAGIFGANMGILMFPNILQARMLFGSARGAKINSKLFNQVVDPKSKQAATSALKLSPWKRTAGYLALVGKNAATEGFWEEGMQFSAEKYFSKTASEGGNGVMGNVGGVFETYMSELGGLDMQKGIFLGGVLGGGMSAITGNAAQREKLRREQALVNTLRKNYTAFSGSIDVFKKVKDSAGVETTELVNGRPVIDEVKLAAVAKEMQEMDDLVALKQAADLAGDIKGSDLMLQEIASRFAMGYLADSAKGYENLLAHARATFELNQTPAEEQGIILKQFENLRSEYKKANAFAQNLKFGKEPRTTTIEAARDKIASTLSVLSARINSLKGIRGQLALEIQEKELDPGLDKDADAEYINLKASLASYDGVISETEDRIKELKTTSPDKLLNTVDSINMFEKYREWAADNKLDKQLSDTLDKSGETLRAKANQQSYADPANPGGPVTEISDITRQANIKRIEELISKGKTLQQSMKEKGADIDALEQQMLALADEMKTLGLTQAEFDSQVDTIKKFAARQRELTLAPSGRLFHDLNTFTKLYHTDLTHEENLKNLLATKSEKEILANTVVRVSKNTFAKSETNPKNSTNTHFVVVSPEYNWEVYYVENGTETRIGNLPEFNKFKLKNGRYLSELVSDPATTEDQLRGLLGIPNLSKTELEKVIGAQQNLYALATQEIGNDIAKSIDLKLTKDFKTVFHKGKYEYVPKNSIAVANVEDVMNNQPAGTEFVLVRIGKDAATGRPTMTPSVLSEKGSKKNAKDTVVLQNEAVAHVESVDLGMDSKAIGSYVMFIKQPSGNQYLVAVKSPHYGDKLTVLFDEMATASAQIKALLSSTEKDSSGKPLMTDPEKAAKIATAINNKIKKTLFIAYPQRDTEMEVSVHPKSGDIWMELSVLQGGKGTKIPKSTRTFSPDAAKTIHQQLIETSKAFSNSFNTGITTKPALDFFIEGVTNLKVFRKAYPEKTKFTRDNTADFVTSTSVDVVSGQGISIQYTGKFKTGTGSTPPPAGGNNNGVTQEEYDLAMKGIWLLSQSGAMKALGLTGKTSEELLSQLEGLIKSGAKGLNPVLLKHYDTATRFLGKAPSAPAQPSKSFEALKAKLISWKKTPNKQLRVDESNTDQYLDENGKPYSRVTSLHSNKATVNDPRYKNRGTIIDDLLRQYIDGEITTLAEFLLAYESHPNKNDTFIFQKEALADLWNIFENITQFAKDNDIELITNLPTFWGTLHINGKPVDAAGTVDLLGIHRQTGTVFIIDLKTSTQNRKDPGAKDFRNYKESDEFQQNAYADLIEQQLGIKITNLRTLPIQSMSGGTGSNSISRFAQNAADGTIFMKVERIPDKFAKKDTAAGSGLDPTKNQPPPSTDLELFKSWVPGGDVSDAMRDSAFAFLNSATPSKQSTAERIARAKAMAFANKVIEAKAMQNFKEGKGPAPVFKLGNNTGEKIDRKEVLDRLSTILPSGISVQFLDNFIDRFPYMGNAMGYYLNQVIYLLESGESGTAYHEAFHAIFRSVLPNETLATLYADARTRYGRPGIVELILFAEERDLLQYDLEERELLWYEEKMADDFQKFMQNQDSGFFTKIWNKILSWLGFVQSHRDTLEVTFKQISKGSFTSSMPVDNIFSAERGLGITPVMKLLTRGFTQVNGTDMKEMLNAQESEMLINKVTHFAHREYIDPDLRNGRSMDDIIFGVIDDLINLYDEVGHIERFENQMSESELSTFLDDLEARGISARMRRLHQTLNNSIAQGEILEAVKYRMSLFQFKESLDAEEKESTEDDKGLRFVKQETERIGGFESLSKWMREYIGFTVKEEKDEFGNTELRAGVPMVKTLDVNKVYNGILRAAANQTDESRFIERLRVYAETNEEAGLFINKFFEDAGIGEDNKPTKGFRLYQGVVKQMSLFKVNYKFVRMNPNDNSEENFKLSNANLHDIDIVQVEQWNNNYMAATQAERDDFAENLKIASVLLKTIQESENTLTVEELNELANQFHSAMTSNGIMNLSKGYSKFVAYSHLPDEHPIRTNRSSGLALSAFQGTELIEIEDLEKIINEHQQDRTPFAYTTIVKEEVISTPEGQPDGIDQDYVEEASEPEESDKTGAVTRARRMARGNSIFDETLGSTSFQNAEGETVYAHQMPTYHLVAIADLKNGDRLGQLANDPFLQNNRILRSVANRTAFQNGEFFRLDGTRAVVTDKSGKINIFREQKSGVTFKHMTPREFMMSMLIMAYKKRNGAKVQTVDENGNVGTMTMQSTLIRVLETSSTADFIDMPAISETFDEASGNINNIVLREFLFRLQSEYSRITRVAKEIEDYKATGKIPEGGWIENYHTGKETTEEADLILLSKEGRLNGFRGIKFDKLEKLMYPKTRNDLTALAVKGVPFEEAMKTLGDVVKNDIVEFTGQEFGEYLGILVEEGIISLGVDPKAKGSGLKYTNQLLPDVMDNNLISWLSDIFFTDWVNTIAINELLIGDEAMGIKDSIDAIKRAKGSNASGFSVAHNGTSGNNPLGEFKKLALTVFKEPTSTVSLEGKDVKNTKIADAQGYMTIRAMKNVLHGLGKLTPEAEVFLDKIERGEKLTEADVFGNRHLVGSISGDYQLNSMKLVYYDGKRYIKLSIVPLTKELTSYKDSTGAWKPKIEMTKLHELREQMENFNDSTDPGRKGIAMSVPESASKMFTADVKNLEKGEDLVFHDTETAYWRLQLENPSNKTTITDPSQIIQLIDSEMDNNEMLSFQGQSTKASDVAKAFRKAAADARENDFRQIAKTVVSQADLKEELFKSIQSGAITPKMKDFLEQAVKTLSASGADSRMIEFFSPNENGEFTFNLNMPATLNKFSELFISHFSKNSLKQKLPGYSVALMSGFGVGVIENADTGEVIQSEAYYNNREQYPNVITRKLAHGKRSSDGTIYSEVLLPAHFAEFLNLDPTQPIPDEVAYMFGIRIPTQDKHSAINLKVVGFLPTFMGSTAIFPDELVALSGADFDIDKMYIHRPAHYVDVDGSIKKFGSATNKDEAWKEFKLWKLTNDKTFKKKYLSLYNGYLERDPSLMTPEIEDTLEMIEESSKQLQEIENDLEDTDVAVKVLHGALSMTDEDWKKYENLSAKYSGDVLAARGELFEKLKSTKEFIREYKNFLRQQSYMDALRFFDLPTSPEKLENSSRELNNGVLYNRMLDAKMALYSADSIKEARQAPANLDQFKALESSEILEGLFSEDYSYQTDNLKGKYIANKTGREGAENIGLAVNGTLAFNVLAKMGSRLSEAGEITTAISSRRGAKGFTPDKFIYKNRKGQRINDLFSNITTAMTDNAKELIAGKYGLSFEAIGVFTHMVGLGYTFEEGLLLINQPVIKVYLDNKRRKASSIITKEEEATFIRDFETAIKVAESQGMVFENEEEDREDLSVTEMVANLKNRKKNKPLNYHTQRKAFELFQQLEEQTTAVQNLNRLIKLVKGINSDFESIDAVTEALDSWLDAKNNPFDSPERLLEENEMVARNLDLLEKLDKISSKLFIERTSEFKSQYYKMLGQLKNPDYTKDTVKKEIKYNLLSFYFLKMYRKIRSDNSSPEAWVNRSYSNFLVFDKTALDLKEDHKSKNPEVSESELNKLFPTITELYNDARKEVDEYGSAQGKRVRNAFLSYIVSKEATKSKNYHSLEARTRVKENPIFMEKIRDGFEELIEGKYGPKSQNFAIAAINYLMIKDGFQFKNSSFINFIPNKYLRMFGSTSFPNGSAVDRVQRIMMNPREGRIEQDPKDKKTKAKWRVDRFKDSFNSTAATMLNRFMGLFAVHPENGYKIFFLRSESGSPFNAALKVKGKPRTIRTGEEGKFETVEQPMINQFKVEKTGIEYLTFDASNEPGELRSSSNPKEQKMTIGNLLQIRPVAFVNDPRNYYAFRRFFKKSEGKNEPPSVYMLVERLDKGGRWVPIDLDYSDPSGFFISQGAKYMKLPVQGIRGVMNIADADAGAPTYGQPMTSILQANFGKKKGSYPQGSSEIDDIMLANMGIYVEPSQQNPGNTTDLTDLIPSGNDPIAPSSELASEAEIKNAAIALSFDGNYNDMAMTFLNSKGKKITNAMELNVALKEAFATLPKDVAITKDPQKLLAWLLQNNC